ncbi:MAG: radical SAM family heme chaperone HemW [Betaproteobacteria bacterium]|nr:radical SAM family heme chaperone HemW [Betaproteobacteria bacterium]
MRHVKPEETSSVALSGASGPPHFSALPPLALYVHIPWCVRKCPYCDFNSHEARGAIPEDGYVAALVADLEAALPLTWGRTVYTVFIGGGTPSVFSARSIDATLAAVRARLPLATDAEITLEANPGTFEAEKFRDFRAAGVNRLSIGVQSFNPRLLKAIGRIHDGDQARRAVAIAQSSFDNVNLDLMYALPGQTLDEARADVDEAIACAPQHVSAYHLTLEPNTYFHRYPPQLPDDDASAAMQVAIEAALAAAGYEHYETSAFARPGMRARHNLNYWTFGDYLGIGAGAHSKLSFRDRILRQMRYRQPTEYMTNAVNGAAVQQEQQVDTREIGFEFMMNALRLTEGFALSLFEERTGVPLTAVLQGLYEAERRGLVARDHRRLAPTPLGQRFLNDLLQIFLAPGDAATHPARPAFS